MISSWRRSLWHSQLSSALRTAVACAIVGVVTLYSPHVIRQHLKFRAFSYMTAVLIVGEATLGDSLKGVVCALYGTVVGLLPAIMTFYLMRPQEISALTTAIAVAISSFLVVLFDTTGLITKRIALGQIVIVYVTAYQDTRHEKKPVLYPVPVAASTALGAVASVLAVVLPYRKLAYYEVSEKSKRYMDLAKARLGLLVNAFNAENSTCRAAFVSQAEALTAGCTKLIQNVKLMQGSMQWERWACKILPAYSSISSDRLQETETFLKGMEVALASTTSFSLRIEELELKEHLFNLRDHISIKLRQQKSLSERDKAHKTILPLHIIPRTTQDLPSFFFLFCMEFLYKEALSTPSVNPQLHNIKVTPTSNEIGNSSNVGEPFTMRRKGAVQWIMNLMTNKFMMSLKCSLSLGLAVFFGVLFSKDDGYWSGLTVAVAFTSWRKATFKMAITRAHGTALGSVFGLIGSFISESRMEIRLFSLLPWIVFTSFLQRSQMYGPIGGFAATISALIILGRRNYGNPIIFTIERLTETYIGLCCSIFVEVLSRPSRASTAARRQLSDTLQTFHECMQLLESSVELREKEKELRKQVNELSNRIQEAEEEPSLWFLPFPIACYNKLHDSLSKMVDLLLFLGRGMEILVQTSDGNVIKETMKGDVDHFRELFLASTKCFEEVIRVESVTKLQKELKKKTSCNNIELGKQTDPCSKGALSEDEEESCKLVTSFLHHIENVMEKLDVGVTGESKSQLVLCISTIAYCIEGLMRKVTKVEKGILELVQWEIPHTHINLYELSCKIKEAQGK